MSSGDQQHAQEEAHAGVTAAPSRVTITEGVVLRPAGPWTPAVHALLRHLEKVGFAAAPRVVGEGEDGHGNETVSYIEGEFVHPRAWSDEGIVELGRLLRRLHDSVAGFVPPPDAAWQPWFTRCERPGSIIGHGDLGPWNIVARAGLPVGIIDWEFAGPVDPLDEVAQAAWLNCQLHDDDVAARNRLPTPEARARQLALFSSAYGLSRPARTGLVTRMVEHAIRDAAHEAIDAGVSPGGGDAGAIWAIAWRTRSAAWMVRHRRLLESALLEGPPADQPAR
ncbi:MAG TPA: aminoglycoside phosphotransferase family protein [Acidimicrobiales bacterium]|nr:aminoglycoside phosphotransferase family protein [Acidimicrobiales bacterium]